MRIRWALTLALILVFSQASSAFAGEQGYWGKLGSTFSKGFKNVISSPWEVPYTIRQHDKVNDGNPRLFRDTAGLFDGLFRAMTRFGSGAWNMAWAFMPGDQEGLSLEPEVFF